MSDLPAGWITASIGQSASFLTGFPFASARFSDSGVRLVRGSNVKRGVLDWGPDIAKYWPADEPSLRSFRLVDDDIVIAMDGALVGRSYARISQSDLPAYLVQRVARLRGKSIDQELLYQWIGSDRFVQHVDSVKTHTAIPHISPRDIRDFPVRIPASSQEQQRIAAALADADRLIAVLVRLIAKKQSTKQGMMQQLITHAANGSGYGKDRWEERSLGQLLLRPPRYGINAAAVPLRPGVATYIRITDINDVGRFAPDPKVGVSHPNAPNYRLASGELVFARTGASVGKSYLYDPRDGELVYAGFLINVTPDPKRLNPRFLALYAQTKEYWDWVARTSVRSGQPGINGQEYAQLPIALPNIETQNAIADAVGDVVGEIDALGRRLEKAHVVKVGMMQQLLTGRTRLRVTEGAA